MYFRHLYYDENNNVISLELECDILVPAALENQITADNIRKIKAKIIAEGANGPCTPEAEEIFTEMGGIIIPDMYCNAGGVTVSYFEWLKNLSHVAFGRMESRYAENSNANLISTLETLTGKQVPLENRTLLVKGASEIELVNSGLEDTMIHSYREIRETLLAKPETKTLRTAAFVNSINKIAISYMNLGIWP